MTLGKIYYLANVLDKINVAGILFIALFTTLLVVVMIIYLADYYRTEAQEKALRKTMRNASVAICLFTVVLIVTPSKEDFLIMSITKDYTPQQIYKMTKEEMKNSIDYLIEQIKEIEHD